MRTIRAVVEISVPDKLEMTEADFCRRLRTDIEFPRVMTTDGGSRSLRFKEFSRVAQYQPDGTRMPGQRKTFERLVLSGLGAILSILATPKQREHKQLKLWFKKVEELSGL